MSNNKLPGLYNRKESPEKDEEFNEALYEIELANLDFFKSQESQDEREKHARLHDYYFVYTSGGVIFLSFLPERELRNDIKEAVIRAFTTIYPDY
jgi:hypothetical protein